MNEEKLKRDIKEIIGGEAAVMYGYRNRILDNRDELRDVLNMLKSAYPLSRGTFSSLRGNETRGVPAIDALVDRTEQLLNDEDQFLREFQEEYFGRQLEPEILQYSRERTRERTNNLGDYEEIDVLGRILREASRQEKNKELILKVKRERLMKKE